jgi:hypothetical protein
MPSISEFLKNQKLLHKVTSGVSDYDFVNRQVGFDDDPNNVASAEASILFAGPPVFDNVGTSSKSFASMLVPIGAAQGFNDSEVPNVQMVPEMGSKLKRSAHGTATYSATIAKMLTYYENLRHACYAWMAELEDGLAPDKFLFAPGEADGTPGHAHFTSMESDLFRVPFGLLLATVGAGGTLISREYYEKCYIGPVGKSYQAGQAIIMEQAQILVTRKVPANNISLGTNLAGVDFTIKPGNSTILTPT